MQIGAVVGTGASQFIWVVSVERACNDSLGTREGGGSGSMVGLPSIGEPGHDKEGLSGARIINDEGKGRR